MSLCVHEAGHAMACFLFRIPMRQITVKADGLYLGKVSPLILKARERLDYEWRPQRQRRLAERIVRCALAGPIAQKEYSRHSFRKYHAAKDGEIAFDIASRVSGSDEEALAWCKLLEIQTRQEFQLEQNWRTLMMLAHKLRKHHTISGREARALLTRSHRSTALRAPAC